MSIELSDSPEYLERFNKRFKGVRLPHGNGGRKLRKFFPNITKGEWQVTSEINSGVNCYASAIQPGRDYFDCHDFALLDQTIPVSTHITSWQRAIALYGFFVGLHRPNKIALISDDDGYVFHAASRYDSNWWLHKMGAWHWFYTETLRQIVGGVYGNQVHFFSSL